ncbi:predicted protein [Postia placenta Mad-698-R]|uniref:HNH nuclease domain-containing protein n=1 Tax=Postia placenta MAD-698-R-SB12 TaxID=670580 RepID=A0A1X6N4T6_9APHY|nr:hypothetical protein POSPLADRAFT_1138734 [Postia placenta MAD-698-R-SB12]EED84937.1 predicted protein [Postia placenta Mad-698-R]OSX63641.1 hypothetical protein POSPLADRAFT_1138734 [Postia placenta MAD-698-R-SB12]
MFDSLKVRQPGRLKDSKKVSYDKSSVASSVPEPEHESEHVKWQISVSDDEDEYTPWREDTPVNETPHRKVRRKVRIMAGARQRAFWNPQNRGTCIVSGLNDGSVQYRHVLSCATKPDVLTHLEWWWGFKEELSVDSRHNQAFRASSFQEACRYAWAYLHTVRGDLHILWDRGDILIAPMPDVVNGYMDKYKDGERHNILEVIDKNKIHNYCVIPHPDLVAGARPPGNCPIREEFTYGFDKVGTIRSHAKPHFMVLNVAMKLKENKGLWAELIMKEEKKQAAEEASSLPLTAPTGKAMTPKHPKALMGPGGFEMDKHFKSKADKPEGESCGSNLKLYAAHLAPTGSRCLLSLQDDKTDNDTCAEVAVWWGLNEFDVDSPFHIFLYKGHLMFVPEPQVIDNHLEQSIVPIDVGMSLDEPFEVCDGPVYEYCVVAHSDLPDTEKNTAFANSRP